MIWILWFSSCSVVYLLGFIVGRNFRDFEGMAATQFLRCYEIENEELREALHKAVSCMKAMQADLEAVAGKSKEASDVA